MNKKDQLFLVDFLSGRDARNRTMIYGFGDRYTNRCTTSLDKHIYIITHDDKKISPGGLILAFLFLNFVTAEVFLGFGENYVFAKNWIILSER